MPLMRFIDLNRDTNNVHKYPKRVNEVHIPVLFRFESMKGLEHTHKIFNIINPFLSTPSQAASVSAEDQ